MHIIIVANFLQTKNQLCSLLINIFWEKKKWNNCQNTQNNLKRVVTKHPNKRPTQKLFVKLQIKHQVQPPQVMTVLLHSFHKATTHKTHT